MAVRAREQVGGGERRVCGARGVLGERGTARELAGRRGEEEGGDGAAAAAAAAAAHQVEQVAVRRVVRRRDAQPDDGGPARVVPDVHLPHQPRSRRGELGGHPRARRVVLHGRPLDAAQVDAGELRLADLDVRLWVLEVDEQLHREHRRRAVQREVALEGARRAEHALQHDRQQPLVARVAAHHARRRDAVALVHRLLLPEETPLAARARLAVAQQRRDLLALLVGGLRGRLDQRRQQAVVHGRQRLPDGHHAVDGGRLWLAGAVRHGHRLAVLGLHDRGQRGLSVWRLDLGELHPHVHALVLHPARRRGLLVCGAGQGRWVAGWPATRGEAAGLRTVVVALARPPAHGRLGSRSRRGPRSLGRRLGDSGRRR